MQVEVWVELGGRPIRAGTLEAQRRGRDEAASFCYTPDYLATPGAYALDPNLPLDGDAHDAHTAGMLFGAMADSTPDWWGRTLVAEREEALAVAEGREAGRPDELHFLLGVRDDLREGALRFRIGGGPFLADDTTWVPALTDLRELLDLAARFEADTAEIHDLDRLVRAGSSLGGARPKTHVLDGNARLSIAKLPSAGDRWNVMAWEKVTLDLAADAGIEVAPSRLISVAGRSVLVVERFDRTPTDGRIGYVSALTMLERVRNPQRSYLDFADVLEQVSPRVTEELRQLWRRMVFYVLVSNTDNHLRNHGFLHERGDAWRMSPAFDLNPDPERGPAFLSTPIADEGVDAASLVSALDVAERFRLTREDAARVLGEVAGAVSRWEQIATAHGLSRSEMSHMAPAFSALSEARGL